MRPRRYRWKWPLVFALVVFASPARADEDPRKAQSEGVFQEALRLHEKHRYQEALEMFRRAYAIYPAPSTLINVARVEGQLRDYVRAVRHLRDALKQPLLQPQHADLGKQLMRELEPHVARVDVKGPRGLLVTVGDEEHTLPLGEPLDLAAGTIVAKGSLGTDVYEGRVGAAEGTVSVLQLVKAGSSATADPSLVTPPPTESDRRFWTTGNTIGVVTGALALTALGVGVGMHVVASSKGDDVESAAKDPSAANGCLGVSSPACDTVRSATKGERDYGNAGNALLISGAVLAVASIGAFIFWPRPAAPSSRGISISPIVGATSGGALVQGRF